jgi:hypothetical protein
MAIIYTYVYKQKRIENLTDHKNIEIVVSRYNESLKWLNDEPFVKYPVICYNKGVNDDFEIQNIKKVVKLTNVGRESHTYLYHIIHNYNNLADITIFLPGSADLPHKITRSKSTIDKCEMYQTTVMIGKKHESVKNDLYDFTIDSWGSTSKENKTINPEDTLELANIRPFGKWFESTFPNIEIEYIPYNGIFAVSKHHILQHPKSYYEELIHQLSNSSNPEVGHYFERSWAAVFYPLIDAHKEEHPL